VSGVKRVLSSFMCFHAYSVSARQPSALLQPMLIGFYLVLFMLILCLPDSHRLPKADTDRLLGVFLATADADRLLYAFMLTLGRIAISYSESRCRSALCASIGFSESRSPCYLPPVVRPVRLYLTYYIPCMQELRGAYHLPSWFRSSQGARPQAIKHHTLARACAERFWTRISEGRPC
jgi:hypothetical protein